jgi:hypothetical protein
MSLTPLAFTFWIVVVAIQIGVSLQFLGHVRRDNKAEYDRITGGRENLWFAINPLRVGSAYADPVLHKLWGLSEPAMRVGRRLKLVTVLSYLVLLGFVAVFFYESLRL